MEEYSILQKVKIRLGQFHIEEVTDPDTGITSDVTVFDRKEDNPRLELLIKQSTNEVINRRMYPKSYTQEQIDEDLKKFEDVIINLTVYDRSQAGEAYMASYTENGVIRNWKDRDTLLVGVYPFVKVL